MPIPRDQREQLERQRQTDHRLAERDKVWDFVRAAAECWLWLILGLALIAWSVHTTDQRYARIAFLVGLAVGNGGIFYTILSLYRRGEARGDW